MVCNYNEAALEETGEKVVKIFRAELQTYRSMI